jgi:hypothetical protein
MVPQPWNQPGRRQNATCAAGSEASKIWSCQSPMENGRAFVWPEHEVHDDPLSRASRLPNLKLIVSAVLATRQIDVAAATRGKEGALKFIESEERAAVFRG